MSSVLQKRGCEAIYIVRDVQNERQAKYSSYELMKLTFEKIDNYNLVVIDLSEKGVGLGIDAEYVYAKGIPIITIAKIDSDASETLEGKSQRNYFL